jgi:hypothetical protein
VVRIRSFSYRVDHPGPLHLVPVYYVQVSHSIHLALLSDPESSAQALKLLRYNYTVHPDVVCTFQRVARHIVRSTTATPAGQLVPLKAPGCSHCGRHPALSHPRRRLPAVSPLVCSTAHALPAQQPAQALQPGCHRLSSIQSCSWTLPSSAAVRSRRPPPIAAQQQGRLGPGLAQCSRASCSSTSHSAAATPPPSALCPALVARRI